MYLKIKAPEINLDFQWQPIVADKNRILNIDISPSMVEEIPFQKRLPFWNQILDVAGEKDEAKHAEIFDEVYDNLYEKKHTDTREEP